MERKYAEKRRKCMKVGKVQNRKFWRSPNDNSGAAKSAIREGSCFLAPRRVEFSAAKMAFALRRRFQNLPKIGRSGFFSVSRRDSLLGDREVGSEPPFKYWFPPSVEVSSPEFRIYQFISVPNSLEGN